VVDEFPLEAMGPAHFEGNRGDAVFGRLPTEHSRGTLTGHDEVRPERSCKPGSALVVHIDTDVEHVRPTVNRGVEVGAEVTRGGDILAVLKGDASRGSYVTPVTSDGWESTVCDR
jgi:acyl-coenzyme A thioesterase PaaI-like protein